VAAVERSEHVGERPTWDCRVCGQPWPCADAKSRLRNEFRTFPSSFSIYMSAQMIDAASDLAAHGAEPPADLYERFLLWIP
jgi:hypothetical protein